MSKGRELTRAHAAAAAFMAALLIGCDGAPTPPAGPPPPVVPVPASGQIIVQLSGLPANPGLPGMRAALVDSGFGLRVRGPNSFDTLVVGNSALNALAAGRYAITIGNADFGDVEYAGAPDSVEIDLPAGATRVATAGYLPITGGLDLRATGGGLDSARLPALLQRPDGGIDSIALPARLTRLLPGMYQLTRTAIEFDGARFSPSRAVDTFTVTAGPITQPTLVPYDRTLATLRLRVAGAASSARPARLVLVTPTGVRRSAIVTGDSLDIIDLPAGRYVLEAESILTDAVRYQPARIIDTIDVTAGALRDEVVHYVAETAALDVRIDSLPDGGAGLVRVSGPFGFSRLLTATQAFDSLRPGNYVIEADSVAFDGHTFAAAVARQTVAVSFGVREQRSVPYTIATGAITVQVAGLPDGVPANIAVRTAAVGGAPDVSWQVLQSGTRTNLAPGTYALSAISVVSGITLYQPTPTQQTITVRSSRTPVVIPVTYVERIGPTLDFSVRNAYLTQATQRTDGTAPLVAAQPALLRVFVEANQGNADRLDVRVRLYQQGVLYRTLVIPSPTSRVPQTVDEGALAQSWNVQIPGDDVREGLSFVADFGDSPRFSDAEPENNRYPRAGERAVDVRPSPPFSLVLVPIAHPVDGLTGDVSSESAEQFFGFARRIFPLDQVSVTVRTPFTTSAPALLGNDANNGWVTVLNEMRLLQLADANSAHYMGIVGTTYTSGVGGMASIGGRHAITWDKPGNRTRVLAHELGHNFGRFHSPGCGASFIDGSYPYGGGSIGTFGWTGSELVSPSGTNDIMGYCNTQWISDYTWSGIMAYRSALGAGAFSHALRPQTANRDTMLLVWGQIGAESATIEPALQLLTAPDLPRVGSGRYTLEWLDGAGRVLHQLRFDGEQVDHRADIRTFAAAVPVRAWRGDVTTLRLREGARVRAELRAGERTVTLVQEARTGSPIGLLRSRAAAVQLARRQMRGGPVVLHVSDGLRSRPERMTMP